VTSRHRAALLAGILVAIATVFADAAVAAPTVRCRGNERVMLANAFLAVVRGPPVDNDGTGYYGCRRGAERGVFLFSQDYTPLISQLTGHFVVDETVTCDTRNPDVPYCVGYVVVWDTRTGRLRQTTLKKTDAGMVSRASSILVNARGWAAWLRPSPLTGVGDEVWVWAPRARPRLVTSGASIAPASLAITARTLYWSSDGGPRSMALR
jgi:hypothetical protein